MAAVRWIPMGSNDRYNRQYNTLREMPAEVLANVVTHDLRSRPIEEWVGVLATLFEEMRLEYRAPGEIEERKCSYCDAMTNHRLEKLKDVGTTLDLIFRCVDCDKVTLP